jgi:hypothetical protein
VAARQWLLEAQRPDGSWPAFPGQPQGCWVTSVACQALNGQAAASDAVAHGVGWLVKTWPAEGTVWWRLRQKFKPDRIVHQNNALRGWNWTPGTASWVEPTAQALRLLRCLAPHLISPRALERRRLAESMLYDRMCPGGGWNGGNPLVYGVAGVPRIFPTAWALLALRDSAERPEVRMSLEWLEGAFGGIHGPASLALAHRCLAAYGRPVEPLAPVLSRFYAHNGFFDNVLTMAWVALALMDSNP